MASASFCRICWLEGEGGEQLLLMETAIVWSLCRLSKGMGLLLLAKCPHSGMPNAMGDHSVIISSQGTWFLVDRAKMVTGETLGIICG